MICWVAAEANATARLILYQYNRSKGLGSVGRISAFGNRKHEGKKKGSRKTGAVLIRLNRQVSF